MIFESREPYSQVEMPGCFCMISMECEEKNFPILEKLYIFEKFLSKLENICLKYRMVI